MFAALKQSIELSVRIFYFYYYEFGDHSKPQKINRELLYSQMNNQSFLKLKYNNGSVRYWIFFPFPDNGLVHIKSLKLSLRQSHYEPKSIALFHCLVAVSNRQCNSKIIKVLPNCNCF